MQDGVAVHLHMVKEDRWEAMEVGIPHNNLPPDWSYGPKVLRAPVLMADVQGKPRGCSAHLCHRCGWRVSGGGGNNPSGWPKRMHRRGFDNPSSTRVTPGCEVREGRVGGVPSGAAGGGRGHSFDDGRNGSHHGGGWKGETS